MQGPRDDANASPPYAGTGRSAHRVCGRRSSRFHNVGENRSRDDGPSVRCVTQTQNETEKYAQLAKESTNEGGFVGKRG